MKHIKELFNLKEWRGTLKKVPSLLLTLCVISTVLMNILANKSIINLPYLVQDAGLILSWIGFLAGDLIVKSYGVKDAIRVNITSIIIGLAISALLYVVSVIPGDWSPVFNYNQDQSNIINDSINSIIGNIYYVILGSALAMLVGSIFNNVTQGVLLKILKKDNYKNYFIASTLSTILGQFLDNLIFALVISINFFGWTLTQCFICSLFGCLVEMVFEIVFTPITYRISLRLKGDVNDESVNNG